MAINRAIDMTALINRELAKIEKTNRAYGSSVDPAMDAFSDMWKMGQEQKAWNERKNLQRQSIMSDLAKDTSRLYSNKDAKFGRDRLQKYISRHEGSMDESTLEMGQMMLENFDYQIAQNDDFSRYRDGMDSQMQKIDNFLKKPEFEVGKEYTDKEVEEFREVYQGYVDFTEKFMSDHADRLQLAGNAHVLQELSQGSYANKFMLDSFYGDKKIDETEYKAYSQALASNSLEPITKYKEYEKTLIKHSNKSLLDSMDNNAELLRNYNLVKDGARDISAVLGDEYSGSYDMATDEEQDMIREAIVSLEDELQEDDKRHIDRYGISYLYDPKVGILPKVKKPDTNTNTNTNTNTEIEVETKIEVDTKLLDPEKESANVKPGFANAAKRATEKVNKAREDLDNLKANGVVPAYAIPAYGSPQKRVPTQTPIGKYLGLKEGESVSIKQLRKMKAEYDKFTAKGGTEESIKQQIKDINKMWKDLPRDERKASRASVNKEIKDLRKQIADFKNKWHAKEYGYGGTLIQGVETYINRYERAEELYNSELERLRTIQKKVKKG